MGRTIKKATRVQKTLNSFFCKPGPTTKDSVSSTVTPIKPDSPAKVIEATPPTSEDVGSTTSSTMDSESPDPAVAPVSTPLRSSPRKTAVETKKRLSQSLEDDDDEEDNVTFNPMGSTRKKTKPSKRSYPLGTKVYKEFEGHGWFNGEVVSYRGDWYTVQYSDGDQEDCTESELEGILEKKPESPKVVMARPKKRRMIADSSSEEEFEMDEDDSDSDAVDAEESDDDDLVLDAEESDDDDLVLDDDDDEVVVEDKKPVAKTTQPVSPEDDEDLEDVEEEQPPHRKKPKPVPQSQKKESGWGFLNGSFQGAKKGKPRASKGKAKSSNPQGFVPTVNTRNFKSYTDGDDLATISKPQEMFDDMIGTKLTNNGKEAKVLLPLLKKLHQRPLRVATMCSGTESPILALDMLSNSIHDFIGSQEGAEFHGLDTLQLEHVFSCEIEPFKQAYIERNFQPPLLFRDIRELGRNEASTAYGSLEAVPNTPGSVDLLIAGTSCVDYSNLNNEKKTINQKGESGQTFRGMVDWIKKAQPPLVLIENVIGAPWDKKVEIFQDIGYHAAHIKLDTKKYYIPHTRNRGYLLAVRRAPKKNGVSSKVLGEWKALLKKLERPASAALDAFMLPNNDPRVLRGRARLSSGRNADGSSSNAVDWTKCETRHQFARSNENLGDKRPLTGWSDSGNTTMPGFAWNEWTNRQVHRIHDLMDINTLRLSKEGIDPTYKTMVWNLSQNVDRDTMGKLGLSGCLTPTGDFYVTNRGGPLIGEELLLLQGIPAEDLLLTKEAEEQLKDLAGNAMSTTVVGACMLVALVLGHEVLPPRKPSSDNSDMLVQTLVPRPLAPATKEVRISDDMGKYDERTLHLDPLTTTVSAKFFRDAVASAQKCVSEGFDSMSSSVYQCQDCGHTLSSELAQPARKYEEHSFELVPADAARVHPAKFREQLLDALPMQLDLVDIDSGNISMPSGVKKDFWQDWKAALASCNNGFRFSRLERRRYWACIFEPYDRSSKIELRISGTGACWYLFVKPPSKRGALKDTLESPVARMRVPCPNEESSLVSLIKGEWEICLPVATAVEVQISGSGDQSPSWRSALGLKGEFEDERRYDRLSVSLKTRGNDDLRNKIDGEYESLPKCGASCGSLHKRVSSSGEPVYFFLRSGRCTLGTEDSFVFSNDAGRMEYGEHMDVVLQMDPGYRSWFAGDEQGDEVLKASIPGTWQSVSAVQLIVSGSNNTPRLETPSPSGLSISMKNDGWKTCPQVLSCEIPISPEEKLFQKCKRSGVPMDINLQKSAALFQDLAFVTSRLSIPEAFSRGWLPLKATNAQRFDGETCHKCAPALPPMTWALVSKSGRQKYVPVEDGRAASIYEQALKRRPNPWKVQLHTTGSRPQLQIEFGCNAVSICNRALGLFPRSVAREECMDEPIAFDWRIVPHIEKASPDFPKLVFTSNRRTKPASQPPHFRKYKLRPEQLRSLAWMLSQEASVEPFLEQELCEDILPGLSWRAEGRVRRPVLVRGGVIADEVGFGKTAVTLAAIDAAPHVNATPPLADAEGFLTTKATLVVVPGHLMGQWPREVSKFLGKTKKIVVIKTMTDFNKITTKDILTADIVVCNFTVLSSDLYFWRLARLGGANTNSLPGGKTGGQRFDAVYGECIEGLSKRVTLMKEDLPAVFDAVEDDAYLHAAKERAGDAILLDGKKAVYKNTSEDKAKQEAVVESASMNASKIHSSSGKLRKDGVNDKLSKDRDPWGLHKLKDKNKVKCPPLEIFHWERLVVDEFHYLKEKADRARVLTLVRGLRSTFRWCLSGTPPHEDFGDVSGLADLLGIHLGIKEILPGTKISKRGVGEQTGLDKLRAFLENRSLQWHETRHDLAQQFLNRFVRQNVAEIDEIKTEEHVERVNLPSGERAVYLELETYLKSLEAIKGKKSTKSARKSKKNAKGDKESRMQRVLDDSETAEEALVKRASHFNMSSDKSTASETLNVLVDIRRSQLCENEEALCDFVTRAYRQRNKIISLHRNWGPNVDTSLKGEVADFLQAFLNDVQNKGSVSGGADEEVHQKIIAISKRAEKISEKNPKKYDSEFAVANGEQVLDEDSENDKPGDKRKRPTPKKAADDGDDEERLFAMKFALRQHMHRVRTSAKELCGRIRSLRYLERVRQFQSRSEFGCPSCQNSGKSMQVPFEKVGVLSCCGHSGCLDCLSRNAELQKCVDPTCSAHVNPAHVVAASAFDSDNSNDTGGNYGAKLRAIVKRVKDLVAADDRVIVFVQFQDLKQKVAEALEDHGVRTLQVKGTVNQQIKVLDVLQKEKPDKGDPRCLLLTMDDESSAGVNLTTCNHAIFVHPLLADSLQQYKAYETQAIGRIRRYGQTKTVHIWRYLAVDTIDTEIYNLRAASD